MSQATIVQAIAWIKSSLLRLCQKYYVILAIYLIWKLCLVGTMSGVNACSRGVNNEWNQYVVHDKHAWIAPFANWDGQHYLRIAQDGYTQRAPDSMAFYPLFPLVTKLVGWVTTDLFVSAFVVSTVFGLLAALLFYAIAKQLTASSRRAAFASILLLSYPSAFFLTALYSEGLALFVMLGFFYFYAVRPRWFVLPFAFLLPWAKAQGLFVAGLLVVDVLVAIARRQRRRILRSTANLVATGLGVLSVMGFYKIETGNALAPIDAQRHFIFNLSTSNIFHPTHFFKHYFSSSTEWISYNNSWVDKIFIGLVCATAVFVARCRNSKVMCLYLCLFLPTATMGEGGSFVRHSFLVWPFVVLAIFARHRPGKITTAAIAGVLLSAQVYFAYRFAINLWVG